MPKHLRFMLQVAYNQGIDKHVNELMKDLGITYQYSTPQTLGDQIWFWNCENVPEDLPDYFKPLDIDPMECIGYGLSKEDALSIINYKKK